jgi:archaemetzincin
VPKETLPVIAVQPLGKVSAAHCQIVTQALQAHYRVKTVVLPARALPREAYYPPRGRYRADKLLVVLERIARPDHAKIMGLTGVDISTTKGPHEDWGVFGLGYQPGRSCVVSTFRLGKSASAERLARRVASVAVHEIGHTWGLSHCSTPGCVMHDAEGTLKTVDADGPLCPRCRARMGNLAR